MSSATLETLETALDVLILGLQCSIFYLLMLLLMPFLNIKRVRLHIFIFSLYQPKKQIAHHGTSSKRKLVMFNGIKSVNLNLGKSKQRKGRCKQGWHLPSSNFVHFSEKVENVVFRWLHKTFMFLNFLVPECPIVEPQYQAQALVQ